MSAGSTVLDGPSLPQDDTVSHPETDVLDEEVQLGKDVRLFHARVIEAVEAAVETLLEDIAAEIVGRELELQPVHIGAIVDRALQRLAGEEPLRVRVHADDAARVRCGVPVVEDAHLRPGDAVIELRDGITDLTLGARFAALFHGAA
jgi:flagellar biosynthesis/type III secretory pathway protein FliH